MYFVPSGEVTPEDLELGKQIATEANTLLGGIDKNEKVNCYNLNQVGFYNDEVVFFLYSLYTFYLK